MKLLRLGANPLQKICGVNNAVNFAAIVVYPGCTNESKRILYKLLRWNPDGVMVVFKRGESYSSDIAHHVVSRRDRIVHHSVLTPECLADMICSWLSRSEK